MRKLKICAVCGAGLGSALIIKMMLEKVVKRENINAEVITANVASRHYLDADIIVGSKIFAPNFATCGIPFIGIENMADEEEYAKKLKSVIEKIKGK